MKVYTARLKDLALDYITALALGHHPIICEKGNEYIVVEVPCQVPPTELNTQGYGVFDAYSPITAIDLMTSFRVNVFCVDEHETTPYWIAFNSSDRSSGPDRPYGPDRPEDDTITGETPSEAISRFVCRYEFGDTVDVPEQLLHRNLS